MIKDIIFDSQNAANMKQRAYTKYQVIEAIADNETIRRAAVQSNAIHMHYNSDGSVTITYPIIERSVTVNSHVASIYYNRMVRNGLNSYRITY